MSQGNPSNNANLRVVQILPPASDSAFRCVVPPSWERLPVPSAEPDFSDPAAFAVLGAYMEEAGSVIATVAARPAHATGSPARWLAYLCREFGFEVLESASIQIPGRREVAGCRATQAAPRGRLSVRLALIEDQGQWVLVTATAVESRREAMEAAFLELLGTFQLTRIPTSTSQPQPENPPIPFPTRPADREPAHGRDESHLPRPRFIFARA
ncbi:MAG: hypothetical protein AB7O66_04515 [Limisphaerales bacterium]